MRTISVSPSPDMSARKIVSVPSPKRMRGHVLLIRRRRDEVRLAKAILAERRVPDEAAFLRDQDVGASVARGSTNRKLASSEGRLGRKPKALRGSQSALLRPFEEAGKRPLELDQVDLAVSRQIEEFEAPVGKGRCTRYCGERFLRREAGRPSRLRPLAVEWRFVPLVEPLPTLLGKQTGQAFPVDIDPAMDAAVGAARQVLDTVGIDRADLAADDRFAVVEFQLGQGACEITTAGLAFVGILGNSGVRKRGPASPGDRTPSSAPGNPGRCPPRPGSDGT
jgi:hypothetical protein